MTDLPSSVPVPSLQRTKDIRDEGQIASDETTEECPSSIEPCSIPETHEAVAESISENSVQSPSLDSTFDGALDSAVSNALDSTVANDSLPTLPSQAHVSLKDMLIAVEEQHDAESKLTIAIAFMERAMSHKDAPDFRTFYALRKICQELFRGSVAAGLRQKLWGRYSELQDEARRLKQLIDEESNFAVEQIEIAVKGLEEELSNFPKLLAGAPEIPFSATVKAIQGTFVQYVDMQKELQLLSACAVRIHSLRKELMRTPMRIGQKNRFFHRLSVAGDAVFPRRKELMGLLSTNFLSDVEAFCKQLLARDNLSEMVYFLREEVKAFQHYAKLFTLNPRTFNRVRAELGAAWEKLREAEKEHRKERAKLRSISQTNVQKIETELEEADRAFTAGTLTVDEGKQRVDTWFATMRNLEFDRGALRVLQGKLRAFRDKLLDSLRSAKQLQERQQRAEQQQQRAQLFALREQVTRLLHGTASLTAEALSKEYTALIEQIQQAPVERSEKQDLERRLRLIRDVIAERQAKELLALPQESNEVSQQLHTLLETHLQQRNEICAQLEEYRMQQSISGQNFSQALALREQINEEKERLARLDGVIEEIASKLADI